MHDGYGAGGGHWLVLGILMFVFWAAVIAGVVWFVRHSTSGQTPHATSPTYPLAAGPSDGARRILDERFARGEIDVDEYRARRSALDER